MARFLVEQRGNVNYFHFAFHNNNLFTLTIGVETFSEGKTDLARTLSSGNVSINAFWQS
jgi:hypothetical protein